MMLSCSAAHRILTAHLNKPASCGHAGPVSADKSGCNQGLINKVDKWANGGSAGSPAKLLTQFDRGGHYDNICHPVCPEHSLGELDEGQKTLSLSSRLLLPSKCFPLRQLR